MKIEIGSPVKTVSITIDGLTLEAVKALDMALQVGLSEIPKLPRPSHATPDPLTVEQAQIIESVRSAFIKAQRTLRIEGYDVGQPVMRDKT